MNIRRTLAPIALLGLIFSLSVSAVDRLRPAPAVALDYTKKIKKLTFKQVHGLQKKLLESIDLCSSWRKNGADKSKILLIGKIDELSISLDNVRYILENLSSGQDLGQLFVAMNKKIFDAMQCCCRADFSRERRFDYCRKNLLELLHMKNLLFASFLPHSFELSAENKSLCDAFDKFLGALNVDTVVDHDKKEEQETSTVVSKNGWDYAVNLKKLDIAHAKNELKGFLRSYIKLNKTSNSYYLIDLNVRAIKLIEQLDGLSNQLIDSYTAREMAKNNVGYAIGGHIGSWIGSICNWAELRLSKKEQEREVSYGQASRLISAVRSSLSGIDTMLKQTSPDFFDSKEMYKDFVPAQKNGVADTFIKQVTRLKKKKSCVKRDPSLLNLFGEFSQYKNYLKDLVEGSLKGSAQGVVGFAGQVCDIIEDGVDVVDSRVQKLDAKKLIEAFSRKDFAGVCDTLQTVIKLLKYKPSYVAPYVVPFVASSYKNFSFVKNIINQKLGRENAQKAISLIQKYPAADYVNVAEDLGRFADVPVKILSVLVDSMGVYYEQNSEHVEMFVLGLVNNVKSKMSSVNRLKNTVSTKKMELLFSFLTPEQRIECKQYFALVDKSLQKQGSESIFRVLSRQNFLQQPKVINAKKLDAYGLMKLKSRKKKPSVLNKNLNALLDQRSDVLRPRFANKTQLDIHALRNAAWKVKIDRVASIYGSILKQASDDYSKKEVTYKKNLNCMQKKIIKHKNIVNTYKSTWRSFFDKILFRKNSAIAGHEKVLYELENKKKRLIDDLRGHKKTLEVVCAGIAKRSNDLQKGCSLEDAFKKASSELTIAKNAYVMVKEA